MNNYINLAMRTNSHIVGTHGRNSINFTHACLGLVTELDELNRATDELNEREEKGDMCWYIALACDAFDVEWPDQPNFSMNYTLDELIFILADLSKKWFAYGKRPHGSIVEVLLIALVNKLGTPDEVADMQQRNIDKLRARFPDTFTAQQAIERDLNNERQALGQTIGIPNTMGITTAFGIGGKFDE